MANDCFRDLVVIKWKTQNIMSEFPTLIGVLGLIVGDQRAYTFIGEDFQHGAVADTAINDMRAGHAAFYCIKCALNFGQHATVDGAIFNQSIHLFSGQACQNLTVFIHQTGNVSKQ